MTGGSDLKAERKEIEKRILEVLVEVEKRRGKEDGKKRRW